MRPCLHKILAADRAADREKRLRQRRRDAGEFGDRHQERQPEPQILAHVAMLRQHEPLAPVAGIGEAVMRAAAIHPDLRLPSRSDAPAENAARHSRSASRTAMRSASSASVTRRIAACVPSLWMSQRSKCSIGPAFITISGGWMIGPAFISAPDSASPQGSITPGKARPITSSAWSRVRQRKHADRQPLGADGDRDLERAVLARQPGQRAGLGKAGVGAVAGVVRGLGEDHRCRTSPAAGTRPGRRADAARAAWRYPAARRRARGTGSARRRRRLRRYRWSPARASLRAGRWHP